MAAGRDERRALWILRAAGTAVILLSAILLAVLPAAPVSENVPGFSMPVVGFELAGRPEHVFGILGDPSDPARRAAVRRMDLGNRIDFFYLLAYPAFYVGLGLFLRARQRVPRGVATLLLVLPLAMAAGDALENRELLLLSQLTDTGSMGVPLERLRTFTLIKWYAIYGASGIAALYIWREAGWWRWSAVLFAAAALLGFSSVVYLPGIEHGSLLLVPAWIMTYVRSLRSAQERAKAP
jgi:hypothetical protein